MCMFQIYTYATYEIKCISFYRSWSKKFEEKGFVSDLAHYGTQVFMDVGHDMTTRKYRC